jgi:hypothetical protein
MNQVVTAMYDYISNDPQHLSFAVGSSITVITKDPSGWWYGSQNGNYGWLPSNFIRETSSSAHIVQVLTKAIDDVISAIDSSDRKLIMDNARTLWSCIKKLPQHKINRKVERKISNAIVSPCKSMSEWIDKLEEVVHLCLDMIENVDNMESLSTTSIAEIGHSVPATPLSAESLGDDLVFNSLGKVKSGSLEGLMKYLVDPEKSDDIFQTIFLTNYSLHITSKKLLNHLQGTFYDKRNSDAICNLVIRILKTWINSFLVLTNESDTFFVRLHKFIDSGIRSFSPDDANECIQLLKLSRDIRDIRCNTSYDVKDFVQELESLNIMECDATDICEILDDCYVKLFNQIECTDWLLEKVLESDSVAKMVNFSKYVSKWVKGILSAENESATKVFKLRKLIKVSHLLFNLKNFQGVKDIIGEIHSSIVTKYSRNLDSSDKEILKKLHKIVIPKGDSDYSVYHHQLKNIEGSYLPLLLIHCSSLSMINNQLNNLTPKGFINFSKMAMISFAMEKILASQRILVAAI